MSFIYSRNSIYNRNDTMFYFPKEHFGNYQHTNETKNSDRQNIIIIYDSFNEEIIELKHNIDNFSTELAGIRKRLQDLLSPNAGIKPDFSYQQEFVSTDDEAEGSTVDDEKSEPSLDEPYEF
jgi:hypothetical protein